MVIGAVFLELNLCYEGARTEPAHYAIIAIGVGLQEVPETQEINVSQTVPFLMN